MGKRLPVVIVIAILVAVIGYYVQGDDDRRSFAGAPGLDEMADDAGALVMRHLQRGHVEGVSGDVALLPRPHRFMANRSDLQRLGTDNPETFNSHPNPWDYLVRVPLVFSGSSVGEGQTVYEPTDLTAVPATFAEILGLDFDATTPPLKEVSQIERPRVIVTVVMDGGGWNVLRSFPGSWPELRELMADGLTYVNATVGSAPTVTGPVHANLGTGSYPARHGIANNPRLSGADPTGLRVPSLSDVWGQESRAFTGMVAYESFHLGMLGHGAQIEGGDKDMAVMWAPKKEEWWTNGRFFTLPTYLQGDQGPALQAYEEELDARDGLVDGSWFDHTEEEIREDTYRAGTPAFVRLTADVVMEVLAKEAIGTDDETDLLWVELKSLDYAGHAWTLSSPEMGDTLREVSAQIGRMKAELERRFGTDGYLMVITADHGMEPLPEISGGWRVLTQELLKDLTIEFGPVIAQVTPTDIVLDRDALEGSSVTPTDIARFVALYTIGDNIPEGEPGAGRVPKVRLDETLFVGAFPGSYLGGLSAEEIDSFGTSEYEQGAFYITRSGGRR